MTDDLLGVMKHGHVCPIANQHYAWAVAEITRLRNEQVSPPAPAPHAEVREALEFYADPFAWKKKHDPEDVVRVPDFYSETSFGDTALEALSALALPQSTDGGGK